MSSEYHLVVRNAPKSPAAEAVRLLRTNLQYVSLDRPLKSLMITSAGPGEGKTSICANLAVSLAEAGKRTIVVGADLRAPTVHKALGCSNNGVGLTTVLAGQAPLEEAIQETDIEGVRLVPSGPIPPNPAELIGSGAMEAVVRQIAQLCDIALYDATPVLAVADALLLSRAMDGVLLVVSVKRTPREVVAQAKEQLEQVQARIVGVVANRVEYSGRAGYYYYGYYSAREAAAGRDAAGAVVRPARSGLFARLAGRGQGR